MKANKFKVCFTFLSLNLFILCQMASAQTWLKLGKGCNARVNALTVWNGNLYAGGFFDSAGGKAIKHIAEWNGSSWSALGIGVNGTVYALDGSNGSLILGGSFDSAGGKPAKSIAQWNGSNWSALGSGTDGTVYALTSGNGNEYVGGYFDSAGGQLVNSTAIWNGSSWSAMSSGILFNPNFPNDGPGTVYALTTYNSNIYAGGQFWVSGNTFVHAVLEWNGSAWVELNSTKAYDLNDNNIYALTPWNSNLYLGGTFSEYGINNKISEWNGSNWDSLGSVNWEYVYAEATWNGNLYVGGGTWYSNLISSEGIAEWDGSNWDSLSSGMNGVVYAITAWNGNLYAAGLFLMAGTTAVNDIAEWSSPAGMQEIAESKNISIYPNPCNGNFTIGLQNISGKPAIQIYNFLGKQVYNAILNKLTTQINIGNQPPGLYLYRVNTEEGQLISSGKLIIE